MREVITYKHLYERIMAFENLYLAFRKARRGKRGHPDVATFEMYLEDNLLQLHEALLLESYWPGPYTHFMIYDGKPRRISAAPFPDRVMHHALCNVIEPIWEARFIYDSYACRPRKGTHAALDRCTAFARRFPYVLQCDIVQFFPSIDHQVLLTLLNRYIVDPRTLNLCQTILDSGAGIHNDVYRMVWFPGDDLLAAVRPRGLPIGNQTSQFWGNVYLHDLDCFIKHVLRCPAYLRYCDDFLLFADDKATLHRWHDEINRYLERLRLVVHPEKSRIYPVRCGIPLLGFQVFPDHRRLKRSNGVAFVRRFRRQVRKRGTGRLAKEALEASLRGWIAHASHGDTRGLRRRLISSIRIPARPGSTP